MHCRTTPTYKIGMPEEMQRLIRARDETSRLRQRSARREAPLRQRPVVRGVAATWGYGSFQESGARIWTQNGSALMKKHTHTGSTPNL